MYTFENIFQDKVTSWELKERGKLFVSANTPSAVATLLGTDLTTMKNLIKYKEYTKFYVPKRNGEQRLIETPGKGLQRLLKRLSAHLHAVYHTVLPDAAYGSIPSTADQAEPRNIYTNALQHVKQKWLLHLDLKDFFHSISFKKVVQVFRNPPFSFEQKLASLLAAMATNENHLPIGASSSPAIANLSCLELDEELEGLAKKKGWKYTRYMDDLSFSGMKKFGKKTIRAIREIIEKNEFTLNEEKMGHYRIKDEPTVTGLVLKPDKPDLSEEYIKNLDADIEIYHILTSERMLLANIFPSELLRRFRNHLAGRVNFVRFIRGEGHASYLKLKYKLKPGRNYLD